MAIIIQLHFDKMAGGGGNEGDRHSSDDVIMDRSKITRVGKYDGLLRTDSSIDPKKKSKTK